MEAGFKQSDHILEGTSVSVRGILLNSVDDQVFIIVIINNNYYNNVIIDFLLTGEMHMGGQEHFYLETNFTLAVPKEEVGEMELFVSTQAATKTQVPTLKKKRNK